MRSTIDAAGRLVIPSAVRREAGIKPGTPLEVTWKDGRIEIEPLASPVQLRRRGRLLVASRLESTEALDNETVEKTRLELRNERGSSD
jgi:AbrB family looped-hinge helix DNA binding protein